MILLTRLVLILCQKPTIDSDKDRWKPYYTDIAPTNTAENSSLSFEDGDRKSIKNLKIISIFGDHRDSYLKGHIHTAIDINPAKPKEKLFSV